MHYTHALFALTVVVIVQLQHVTGVDESSMSGEDKRGGFKMASMNTARGFGKRFPHNDDVEFDKRQFKMASLNTARGFGKRWQDELEDGIDKRKFKMAALNTARGFGKRLSTAGGFGKRLSSAGGFGKRLNSAGGFGKRLNSAGLLGKRDDEVMAEDKRSKFHFASSNTARGFGKRQGYDEADNANSAESNSLQVPIDAFVRALLEDNAERDIIIGYLFSKYMDSNDDGFITKEELAKSGIA